MHVGKSDFDTKLQDYQCHRCTSCLTDLVSVILAILSPKWVGLFHDIISSYHVEYETVD